MLKFTQHAMRWKRQVQQHATFDKLYHKTQSFLMILWPTCNWQQATRNMQLTQVNSRSSRCNRKLDKSWH